MTQEERRDELSAYGLDEFETELMTTPLKQLNNEEKAAAIAAHDKYTDFVRIENQAWIEANPTSPISRIAQGRLA